MKQAPSTDSQLANAVALRMTRSRMALREALQNDPAQNSAQDNPAQESSTILAAGVRLLKSQRSAHLISLTLKQLWANNPWHILGNNAAQAAGIMLTPVAQRSPVKLVAGAFVMGGVLFLARPWRLLRIRGLIAGLLAR